MIIDRTYLVELNLASISANQRYNFQYLPDLEQKAMVYGIQAFTSSQILLTANQKNVVTNAGAANLVLTLVVGDTEEVYNMSYLDLNPVLNAGFVREFTPRLVNISKSYITALGTAGLTPGESALINFIFHPR